MKVKITPPYELHPTEEVSHVLIVDFHDQYHAVRRAWGDRKINVAALCRFFESADRITRRHVTKIAFLKAPDLDKVRPFDKVLEQLGFMRVCIYQASRWINCTALLMAYLVGLYHESDVERFDVVSSDVHIDGLRDLAGDELLLHRYSFGDPTGYCINLPSSLLTPIPVTDAIELAETVA